MTDNQIIIECAKLDGWIEEYPNLPQKPIHYRKEFPDRYRIVDDVRNLPNYLTSRDAIMPLVIKWCDRVERKAKFLDILKSILEIPLGAFLHETFALVTASPRQLCEALLRATGRWKD
jgi:hypothetical protein